MCLRFCFGCCCGWKKKTQLREAIATPSILSGVVNLPKTEEAEPAAATPQVKQQPQIPVVPESLPSQVDKTLAECPM
jgi:hypothetical protein